MLALGQFRMMFGWPDKETLGDISALRFLKPASLIRCL